MTTDTVCVVADVTAMILDGKVKVVVVNLETQAGLKTVGVAAGHCAGKDAALSRRDT